MLKYRETYGINDVIDEATLVASFVNPKEKKIYVFDEHYEKGMTNEDIYKMVVEKGYAKEIITFDSAEPKSIDHLKKLGLYRVRAARKGKDSILNGIDFIQQFQVVVHPKCKNFIMELENYTWKKDKSTNEYINTPIDNFNHLLDAWRYSLEEIQRNMKKKIRATSRIY